MKKYFLTGLVTMLPVVITVWVVSFIVDLLTRPFIGFVTDLLSSIPIGRPWTSEPVIRVTSQILIIISSIIFILVLGLVARWFFFRAFLKLGENILRRIPFLKKVYVATKDFIAILFSPQEHSFSQVVMVPFPYEGCYCLGLITRDAPQTCSQVMGTEMVSVFIPTTPNPFTGFLITSPKSALIFLEMKSDEALKYIVSCGVVQPKWRENK